MTRRTATPDEKEAMRRMRKIEVIAAVLFLLFIPFCILCHQVLPSLMPYLVVLYICVLAIPGCIQIKTRCPRCGERFYVFTPREFGDYLVRAEDLPPGNRCQNCGFHL
jgi:hypothetical protein